MKKNKKGSVAIYLAFMISAITIVLVAAVFAPLGVLFNTRMYEAGEDILLRANTSIQNINDDAVRENISRAISTAFEAQENNIEVNANIFQYSWIFIVALSALVVFLFTRRLVEVQGGGIV